MTKPYIRWWWVGAALAAATVSALSVTQLRAEAQAPLDRGEVFLERLRNMRTWYTKWERQSYAAFGDEDGGRVAGDPPDDYTLRIDADANVAVLDAGRDAWRYRWDGEHLTWAWRDGVGNLGTVYDYPPAVDAIVADLWGEMLSGFANTEVVAESPMDRLPIPDLTAPRYRPKSLGSPGDPATAWRRFALPFDWASDVWVYVLFYPNGTPTRVVGLHRTTGEMMHFGRPDGGYWAEVGGREEQYWDVPLNPNISDAFPTGSESFKGDRLSVRAGTRNRAPRVYSDLYHDASTMAWPTFDPTSIGEIEEDGVPHSSQSIFYRTCSAEGPLATLSFDFRWNLTEPDDVSRLTEALEGQCPVTLSFEPWTGWVYDLGVTGTVAGMMQLRDRATNPPTVLTSQPFGATRPRPQESQGPHPIVWSVPASVNPDHLQVRLIGQLSATCGTMRSPPQQLKQIGLKVAEDEAYAPLLSWFDCWPGW
jgi:hypothetical protein